MSTRRTSSVPRRPDAGLAGYTYEAAARSSYFLRWDVRTDGMWTQGRTPPARHAVNASYKILGRRRRGGVGNKPGETAMCFSAEASFTSAAALLPVGGYCVARALRNDWRFLPLALTPVAFSVQQAAEGCVWLGLGRGDAALVARASAAFLFFALVFWPFWIPFSLLFAEGRRPTRWFLGATTALSLVWLWLYAPVALDPGRWLSTEVVRHSISYRLDDLPAFRLAPRIAWRVAYLVFIIAPLAAARPGGGLLRFLAGGAVAALFLVCWFVYWYAFTSVWCFFAALLSLLLGYAFFRLPVRREPAAVGRTDGTGAGSGGLASLGSEERPERVR